MGLRRKLPALPPTPVKKVRQIFDYKLKAERDRLRKVAVGKEARVALAIAAVEAGTSVMQAAYLYAMCKATLQNRFKSMKPHCSARGHLQRLSPSKESAMIDAIYQLDAWGWPMTVEAIRQLARNFLVAKKDNRPLGRNWYLKFLSRHPELHTRRARTLEQSRQDAQTDVDALKRWFELVATTRLKYDIQLPDEYNMDEKGVLKGIGQAVKVLVSRKNKAPTIAHPGNRENVSIIECVSAVGYAPPAYVIFQGQTIQWSWTSKATEPQIRLHVSEHGWTDQAIALQWLKHFDLHTRKRTVGQYRLLILDGHSSHVSVEFVQFCHDHRIVPLCLPPHATHLLQPLDLVCFAVLQRLYKTEVIRHALFMAERVNNHQFLLTYQMVRACIARTGPAAWRAAGLWPFNPDKVLDKLKPHERQPTRLDREGPQLSNEEIMAALKGLGETDFGEASVAEIASLVGQTISKLQSEMEPSVGETSLGETSVGETSVGETSVGESSVAESESTVVPAQQPVEPSAEQVLAVKVNLIKADLLREFDTPRRRDKVDLLTSTCLTQLASNVTLSTINKALVTKAAKLRRKKASRKNHGEARELTVEACEAAKAAKEAEVVAILEVRRQKQLLRDMARWWKEMSNLVVACEMELCKPPSAKTPRAPRKTAPRTAPKTPTPTTPAPRRLFRPQEEVEDKEWVNLAVVLGLEPKPDTPPPPPPPQLTVAQARKIAAAANKANLQREKQVARDMAKWWKEMANTVICLEMELCKPRKTRTRATAPKKTAAAAA